MSLQSHLIIFSCLAGLDSHQQTQASTSEEGDDEVAISTGRKADSVIQCEVREGSPAELDHRQLISKHMNRKPPSEEKECLAGHDPHRRTRASTSRERDGKVATSECKASQAIRLGGSSATEDFTGNITDSTSGTLIMRHRVSFGAS